MPVKAKGMEKQHQQKRMIFVSRNRCSETERLGVSVPKRMPLFFQKLPWKLYLEKPLAMLILYSPSHISPPKDTNYLNTRDEMKAGVGTILCLTTKAKDWGAVNANAKHNYKPSLGYKRYLSIKFCPGLVHERWRHSASWQYKPLLPAPEAGWHGMPLPKLVLQNWGHSGTVSDVHHWTRFGICARCHKPAQCHGPCWWVTSRNDPAAGMSPGTVW